MGAFFSRPALEYTMKKNLPKLALALTLSALLGGCASFDAAQRQLAGYGATAADKTLESAQWALCQGITVGAWRRAYGADPVRAQAWSRLCAPPAATPSGV